MRKVKNIGKWLFLFNTIKKQTLDLSISTLRPFRMITRPTPQWALIGQSAVKADLGSYEVVTTPRPLRRPGSTLKGPSINYVGR